MLIDREEALRRSVLTPGVGKERNARVQVLRHARSVRVHLLVRLRALLGDPKHQPIAFGTDVNGLGAEAAVRDRPSVEEAEQRLDLLREQGPTPAAFTFRASFDSSQSEKQRILDEWLCPA